MAGSYGQSGHGWLLAFSRGRESVGLSKWGIFRGHSG